MVRTSVIGKIFATTVVCFHALLLQETRAGSWKIETVEVMSPPGPMFVLSLALDGQGNPHVAYLQAGTLLHAFKMNASWTTEVVDGIAGSEAASTSNSGWITSSASASIAAADDLVHIAYIGNPPILKHAVRVDGRWSSQTVDERASSSTRILGLAMDEHANPHISYCGYPSRLTRCGLKHAFKSSGVWHIESVDSTTTGTGTIFAVASPLAIEGDIPHLVTMENRAFQYTLRYASREPNWFIETITEDGGEDVSIGLDSKGRPHVAWAVNNALRHAWRSEGEWQVEEFFESAEPTWSILAIAVDAQDNVHIAHCHEAGMRYLVRRETGGWDVEIVDDAAGGGGFPFNRVSMALDARGRPHLVYIGYDEVLRGTRYIRYAHLEIE